MGRTVVLPHLPFPIHFEASNRLFFGNVINGNIAFPLSMRSKVRLEFDCSFQNVSNFEHFARVIPSKQRKRVSASSAFHQEAQKAVLAARSQRQTIPSERPARLTQGRIKRNQTPLRQLLHHPQVYHRLPDEQVLAEEPRGV